VVLVLSAVGGPFLERNGPRLLSAHAAEREHGATVSDERTTGRAGDRFGLALALALGLLGRGPGALLAPRVEGVGAGVEGADVLDIVAGCVAAGVALAHGGVLVSVVVVLRGGRGPFLD
jgi:hypothetical protein